MTVSRANQATSARPAGRPLAPRALALAVWLAAMPAVAQAPVQLNPPGSPPPAQVPAPQVSGPTAAPLAGTIVIERIGAIDNDSVGLLGPGQGGLGIDMWRGTSRAVAEALLPRLTAQGSRAGHLLARRLLLSAANPPAGDGVLPFVALRADRLVAIGDRAVASNLAATLPRGAGGPELTRLAIDSRLAAGDTTSACAESRAVNLTSAYGQQVAIFCQSLAGETDVASLGIALLRELGDADDVFLKLIANVGGEAPVALADPGPVTPLTFAMLGAANTPPPPWFVAAAPPDLRAAIAADPDAGLGLRLDAAWRAARAGAVDATALAAIYAGLDPAEVAAAAADPAAIALATGWITAAGQTVPAARAEALGQYADTAALAGVAGLAAPLIATALDDIAPASDLAWFAATAGRAWLAAGAPAVAAAWHDVATAAAASDPEAAAATAALAPLLRLATVTPLPEPPPAPVATATEGPLEQLSAIVLPSIAPDPATTPAATTPAAAELDAAAYPAWLAVQPDPVGPRAARMLALLAAVGEPVAVSDWVAVIGEPAHAAPPASLWLSMQAAAADRRVAETALLALLVLGETPVADHSPVTLHGVVTALRTVGLTADAHALAVEAALAAGL